MKPWFTLPLAVGIAIVAAPPAALLVAIGLLTVREAIGAVVVYAFLSAGFIFAFATKKE
jgi:hypothetical protein